MSKINNNSSTCYRWNVVSEDSGNATILLDHNIVGIANWNSTGNLVDGPVSLFQSSLDYANNWVRVEPLNYSYDVSGNTYGYGLLKCVNGVCNIGSIVVGSSQNPVRTRAITVEEISNLAKEFAADSELITKVTYLSNYENVNYSYDVSISNLTDKNGGKNNSLNWLYQNTGGTDVVYTNHTTTDEYFGYWTLTPLNENWDSIWGVFKEFINYTFYLKDDGRVGIRTVITVNKSLLGK